MSDNWWDGVRYFKSQEFDSPDCPGSGVGMNRDMVMILEIIRARVGAALCITSGVRTAEQNMKVGGVNCSAHQRGMAADIECLTSDRRFLIVDSAMKQGVKRIGIGRTFVHVDIDPDLPQKVIWLYD